MQKRTRLCITCNGRPRNSRYGSLCTNCGKAVALKQAGEPPVMSRTEEAAIGAASTGDTGVCGGSLLRLGALVGAEVLASIRAKHLTSNDFERRLLTDCRISQELGHDAELRSLVMPFVEAALEAAGSDVPSGVALLGTEVGILLLTATDTGKPGASAGRLHPRLSSRADSRRAGASGRLAAPRRQAVAVAPTRQRRR